MNRIDQIRLQYGDLLQDSLNNLTAYKTELISLEVLGLNELEYRHQRQELELEAKLLGHDLKTEFAEATQ